MEMDKNSRNLNSMEAQYVTGYGDYVFFYLKVKLINLYFILDN